MLFAVFASFLVSYALSIPFSQTGPFYMDRESQFGVRSQVRLSAACLQHFAALQERPPDSYLAGIGAVQALIIDDSTAYLAAVNG